MSNPKFREDLVITQQIQRGNVVYIVKDPLDGQYYRFGSSEFSVIKLFNGKNSTKQVNDLLKKAAPEEEYTEEDINDFVKSLTKMNLIEKSLAEKNTMLISRLQEERKSKLLSKKGSIMYKRFPVFNPEKFFSFLHPKLRFFWKTPFVIFCLIVMALSASIILYNWREVLEGIISIYSFHKRDANSIAILWLFILFIIGLHECAHGLTCKNFGGRVPEIGFLLLFFQPCLYCNVNDAWTFQNKKHKLYVVFAGGYFELLIGSIFVFIWILTNANTDINAFAYQGMTVCGLSTVLFNFNPLMKLDGYYALADYLEIPNLKQEAANYIKAVVRVNIFRMGDMSEFSDYDRKSRRSLLIYGICSVFYMTGVLLGLLMIVKMLVLEKMAEAGGLLLILAAYKIFGGHITKTSGFIKEFFVSKNIKLKSIKGIIIILFSIILLVLLLFVIKYPDNITSDFSLVSTDIISLKPSLNGTLKKVFFNQSDIIKKGNIVAELENTEKQKSAESKKIEIEKLRIQLLKYKSEGDVFESEKLENRIIMMKRELDEINKELESLKLVAPEESVLLTGDMEFETGKKYSKGEEVIRLMPLKIVNAEINISEENIGSFKQGAEIKLKFNAMPDKVFTGKINKFLPKTSDDKNFGFTALAELVDIENIVLFSGMKGRIRIENKPKNGIAKISGWLIRNLRLDIMFY